MRPNLFFSLLEVEIFGQLQVGRWLVSSVLCELLPGREKLLCWKLVIQFNCAAKFGTWENRARLNANKIGVKNAVRRENNIRGVLWKTPFKSGYVRNPGARSRFHYLSDSQPSFLLTSARLARAPTAQPAARQPCFAENIKKVDGQSA